MFLNCGQRAIASDDGSKLKDSRHWVRQGWGRFGALGVAGALLCHVHVSECLWLVDLDSRVTEGNVGFWVENRLKVTEHLVQGPHT